MSLEGEGGKIYLENKEKLAQALKKHGQASVLSRPEHGHVGLWNQGATCYLNSIVQCLCADNDFSSALFNEQADNGTLTKELQRLFAQLRLSEQLAVSTKGLTSAFGWKDGQAHEQHDAHELFSLLLDSLVGKGTKELFEAKVKDCLMCPSCNKASSNSTSNYSLSVDIPDAMTSNADQAAASATTTAEDGPASTAAAAAAVLETVGVSTSKLTDLLQQYFEPEELDSDNMWTCTECNTKVQASKSQCYESFPKKLMIQLKRFRFDPMARRRRKLQSNVLIPMTLTAADLSNTANPPSAADASVSYELSSVILHTGTAQGGHYRAYCKQVGSGKWFEYNDSTVTELDDKDVASLFWFTHGANAGALSNSSATAALAADFASGEAVDSKRDLLYENAYMLHYTRSADAAATPTVPDALAEEVKAENSHFQELQKAYEVMKNIVTVTAVAVKSTGGAVISRKKVTLEVKIDSTLAEMTKMIYDALCAEGVVAAGLGDDSFRMRKFNPTTEWLMETFTGKEGETLKSLGLEGANVIPLALEVRPTADDEAFSEFNPNQMRVRCFKWTDLVAAGYASTASTESTSSTEDSSVVAYEFPSSVTPAVTVVPGDGQANVKDLRDIVAKQNGCSADNVNIIRCMQRNVVLLEDDSKTLREYCINPDEEVIVEIIPEGETRANFASVALEKSLQLRRNITLQFNNPRAVVAADPAAAPAAPIGIGALSSMNDDATLPTSNIYTYSCKVPLETTLADVKIMICKVINAAEGADPTQPLEADAFHLRRNATAPQLKDEKKTLEELEFVNYSVVHTQMGAGCKPGEYLLRFELDCSTELAAGAAGTASAAVGDIVTSSSATAAATSTNYSLGDIKIREKMTVAQVKALVLTRLNEVYAAANAGTAAPNAGNKDALLMVPLAPSINHIRLRDGKNKGSSTGGPLRDERIIGRCLLNMDDGRKILVQSLKEPEIITADDIVLSLRIASYYNKTLSKVLDFPINRTSTIAQLFEKVLEKYPYLGEEVSMVEDAAAAPAAEGAAENPLATFKPLKVLAIAKGYTTGPPLSLKSALKLKWNDDLMVKEMAANPKNSIDKLPMNLRDGSVLVVRSTADFERAKSAVQARKAANNENGTPAAAPSGGSVRARLASRGGARSRLAASSSSGGLREPSLKIDGGNSPNRGGDAADSGGIAGGNGVAAGSAVRMVQALKDTTNTTPVE